MDKVASKSLGAELIRASMTWIIASIRSDAVHHGALILIGFIEMRGGRILLPRTQKVSIHDHVRASCSESGKLPRSSFLCLFPSDVHYLGWRVFRPLGSATYPLFHSTGASKPHVAVRFG